MTSTFAPSRFGTSDFTNSLLATARQYVSRGIQLAPPSVKQSRFTSSDPTGFAEYVNHLVVDRSATLPLELRRTIEQLSNLTGDWDGRGAKPVKGHVLADTVEALKYLSQHAGVFQIPFLAPTFDGFVQMEWNGKQRSLEIEAVPNGWCVVGTMMSGTANRLYFTADCESLEFLRLGSFYKWFLGDELIWPSP